MSKNENKQEEQTEEKQTEETQEAVTVSKRDVPVVVIPIYKEDAEALGHTVGAEKDANLNAKIRNEIREKLGLPARVRGSGVQAQIKDKLGLSADATPSDVNKAMRQKILGL